MAALPGGAPHDILVDHRRNPAEPNPYKSRFGDKWMEEIKKSTFLSKFVGIQDLVMHVYKHTKECFKDTEYKGNFFVYHNALSLMTASDTREWMEERIFSSIGSCLCSMLMLAPALQEGQWATHGK